MGEDNDPVKHIILNNDYYGYVRLSKMNSSITMSGCHYIDTDFVNVVDAVTFMHVSMGRLDRGSTMAPQNTDVK